MMPGNNVSQDQMVLRCHQWLVILPVPVPRKMSIETKKNSARHACDPSKQIYSVGMRTVGQRQTD